MAMLKNKHITVSLILVCLIVVSPMAKAQLGLGGLLGGTGGLLGGTGGLLGGLLNLASIKGIVFCTPNGNISLNSISTPAFANAVVELQCGSQNTVVSSTTTNGAGIFSIPTNLIQMLISKLLSECSIVVTTPLASCNATLPSAGKLVSPLTVLGTTVSGLLNIINLGPSGFSLIN